MLVALPIHVFSSLRENQNYRALKKTLKQHFCINRPKAPTIVMIKLPKKTRTF